MGTAAADEVGSRKQEVIDGTRTPDGMFPESGALLVDFGNGPEPGCSGTLIAPRVVLTAGHCVDPLFIGEQIPSFTLVHDANQATSADIVAGVEAHQHPQFDLQSDIDNGVSQWNDIALLVLAEDVSDAVVGVLPSPDEVEHLTVGLELDLVGYGLTSNDSFSAGVKHHGRADLIEVGDYELLISEPGQQQNCNGDSGGPAFAELGGGPRVVGVVSRSPDDDPNCDHGGIDTRVDAYLEWIHGLVEVPCGGLAEPCRDPEEGGCGCTSSGQLPGGGAALALLTLAALFCRRRTA